jgi:hypothetical protein
VAIFLRVAAVGGLGVAVATLAWGSRGWPLIHDAPIMHYVAWRIGAGDTPYRDLFDMNFPGTYLMHAAVLWLMGPGDGAWRVFDLVWLVAGAAAVAALAWPWGWLAGTIGALFFALHHLAAGPWQTGQRDFLLCPFLLLATLAVARWIEHRGGLGVLGCGGLALGAAITIKPHVVLLAVVLGGVVGVGAWRAGAWAPAAAFAAGLAVPPLAVVVWVAALGGGPAWRSIVLEYLVPLYSGVGRPDRWGFHRWEPWLALKVALVLSLVSAVAHRRVTPRHALAVVGLAYGVVHYLGQGKGWEYHIYPLAAFTAVLLGAELEPLLRSRRFLVAGPLTACLLLASAGFWLKGAEAARAAEDGWIAAKQRRVSALAADLGARLRAGDLVQVLDTSEGGVHALLRLHARQPSRFLYDFHFFHDVGHPVVRGLRRELLDALAARPPRFIVLFREGWPAGGYERLAAFGELARWLEEGYRLVREGDGYRVYAQRNDS